MTTITQSITALPPVPNPATMTPEVFSTTAAAFVLAQKAEAVELETFRGQVNTVAGEMVTNAATATTQAGIATAKAVLTAADAVATAADAIATAADRVQTGLDRVAAAASASSASSEASAASASASSAATVAAAIQATSTTSLAIAIASKTFTTQAGKQFAAGQWVTATSAANIANWMHGQVTSYSGTTLVVDVQDIGGSGTKTDWNISISGTRGSTGATGPTGPAATSVGDHCVTVHTGNGQGSSSTAIDRFTTTLTNVGTAITYADSATLGATFTINSAGLYEIFQQYVGDNASIQFGSTLNSSELTTNIDATTIASRLYVCKVSAIGYAAAASRTVLLAVNDVVRPHSYAGHTPGASVLTVFSIRKVGLV